MTSLIFNSLSLGAAYALIALGFVLIINACGAVNFAQGDLVVLGGFGAVGLSTWFDHSVYFILPIMAAMGGVGAIAAVIAYLPLKQRPFVSVFISTIALGMILQNGLLLIAGPEPRSGPPLIGYGSFLVSDAVVSRQSVAILVVSILLIAAVYLLLYHTQLGRKLRATAQDVEIARTCGIAVNRMILVTFTLASALAGTAGVLLSYQFFLIPTDGTSFILKGYIAVAIGGWGSIIGSVFGAFLIAFFEILVTNFLSYPIATALLYLTLFLILIFRPQGLLGETIQKRL